MKSFWHKFQTMLTFLNVIYLIFKGWSGGAMVLGKLPVPTSLMIVGQGPIALAVGAGRGWLDIFTLLYPFSPSLWETARYRLKYCLKGPLNPKTTNQPNSIFNHFLKWCIAVQFLVSLRIRAVWSKHLLLAHTIFGPKGIYGHKMEAVSQTDLSLSCLQIH